MRRLKEGGAIGVAGWMQEVTERGIMGFEICYWWVGSKFGTMKLLDGFKYDCLSICFWALFYLFASFVLVDRPRS